MDSISTVASFATAKEGNDSDGSSDEGSNPLDELSQQIISHQQRAAAQANGGQNVADANQPDPAVIALKTRATNQSLDPTKWPSQNSRGGPLGADLVGGLRASKIFSTLLDSGSNSERRLSLSEQEKQLVYGLAASFQQVCMNLQSTAEDKYERKEWRRRLDEARKILDGEQADEAF
jgi:hypothetical protein